jgi:hypothetical protein
MSRLELLERRLFACAWAPHVAAADDAHSAAADSASPAAAAELATVAAAPAYNTAFITDAQLEHYNSMTAAEIRAFLVSRGSYFRQAIADVDGVTFDPAAVIASAAAQYRINPKVILATLQKEHSGITRTTRPSDAQMRFLMGCVSPTTARAQLACAAQRFRSYHDALAGNGVTVSGWRVGVAKATQDGVSVTPASRAVAGQFTYTPYAGVQWGGNRAGVGGVYLFYDWWTALGFADSVRPTAAVQPLTYVAGGAADFTFRITYADAAGVDASTVLSNGSAVRVTGPAGFSRLATFVGLSSSTDGTPRTATYRLAAPGGTWDAADAGAYTVHVQEAQVSDVNHNFVAAGAVGTIDVVRPAAVVGRQVFYNESAFDGHDAAVNTLDDAAVAPDKSALLPGRTPSASNVSSYTRGINGIMVDLRGAAAPGAGDLAFRVGTGGDPSTWANAPAPNSVQLRPGAGAAGADRLSITWAGGAVRNVWLQVTVKATANTRLAAPDVFYFGSLVGDTGGGARVVDASDVLSTRLAMRPGSASTANPADHNRDGRVDVRDVAIARRALSTSLYPFVPAAATAPSAEADAPAAAAQGVFGPANDRRTRVRRLPYLLY